MAYLRTAPLPPLEDKFGNFLIRHETHGTHMLTAEVWEGVNADPMALEPLCRLWVGWDGCSHLWLPYLHFDGLEELYMFGKCVRYIYNDLCERHGVDDVI